MFIYVYKDKFIVMNYSDNDWVFVCASNHLEYSPIVDRRLDPFPRKDRFRAKSITFNKWFTLVEINEMYHSHRMGCTQGLVIFCSIERLFYDTLNTTNSSISHITDHTKHTHTSTHPHIRQHSFRMENNVVWVWSEWLG